MNWHPLSFKNPGTMHHQTRRRCGLKPRRNFQSPESKNLKNKIRKVQQNIGLLTRKAYRFMYENELSPTARRKKETRTKIELGGLIVKAGLLDAFGITLGDNLEEKDESGTIKPEIKALLGALIQIKETIANDEQSHTLWMQKGMKALTKKEKDEFF